MGVCFGCIVIQAITDLITPYRDYLFVSAVDHTDLSKAAACSGDRCAAKTELRRGLTRRKVRWQHFLFCKWFGCVCLLTYSLFCK